MLYLQDSNYLTFKTNHQPRFIFYKASSLNKMKIPDDRHVLPPRCVGVKDAFNLPWK